MVVNSQGRLFKEESKYNGTVELLHADCLNAMREMPFDSVDSIVTDPPYGLSFMGKEWDHGVPGVPFWEAALTVAKPGAHLLAFGGTRTFHRLACAIEDAGWEIRDTIMWVCGSGFPKSLDVSKAIDKAAGAEREVVGINHDYLRRKPNGMKTKGANSYNYPQIQQQTDARITAPATPEAQQWQGWGTALKPAVENIIMARKPFDNEWEPSIIVGNLSQLEAQLWLLLHANTVESSSKSSRSEYDEACAIAQWTADEPRSIRDDLCARMDTSLCEWAIHTTLNTVSSWRSIWEEALRHGSTFTIETATSQIIDLRTLNSYLLALTPQSITQAATIAPGSWWSALPAANILNAVAMKLSGTLELFAAENAIDKGHTPHPDTVDRERLSRSVIVARKPLIGTVAANVLEHGTGAINIDACRVEAGERPLREIDPKESANGSVYAGRQKAGCGFDGGSKAVGTTNLGRWPANLIHDGSDEVLGAFPETASRFFYCAKSSKKDRTCNGRVENKHPTVKPTALMQYLVQLVTPPGGTVLDMFMGSGSTGVASVSKGFSFVGIEQDIESHATAKNRINATISSIANTAVD